VVVVLLTLLLVWSVLSPGQELLLELGLFGGGLAVVVALKLWRQMRGRR
jgi:hypothetical protein